MLQRSSGLWGQNMSVGGHGSCWWDQQQLGRNFSCSDCFWSWGNAAWVEYFSFCAGWDGSVIIFAAHFKVLEQWQIAGDHSLFWENYTLQSALVLGSVGSVPNNNGAGQDGLNEGTVEVHYYWLWQVELPQKVCLLLHLHCQGAFVLRLLLVLDYFGVKEV